MGSRSGGTFRAEISGGLKIESCREPNCRTQVHAPARKISTTTNLDGRRRETSGAAGVPGFRQAAGSVAYAIAHIIRHHSCPSTAAPRRGWHMVMSRGTWTTPSTAACPLPLPSRRTESADGQQPTLDSRSKPARTGRTRWPSGFSGPCGKTPPGFPIGSLRATSPERTCICPHMRQTKHGKAVGDPALAHTTTDNRKKQTAAGTPANQSMGNNRFGKSTYRDNAKACVLSRRLGNIQTRQRQEGWFARTGSPEGPHR